MVIKSPSLKLIPPAVRLPVRVAESAVTAPEICRDDTQSSVV